MLPKKLRLSSTKSRQLRKTANHLENEAFHVWVTPSGLEASPRFLVIISKKTARLATKRNYIRRLIHEWLRHNLSTFSGAATATFVVKPWLAQNPTKLSEKMNQLFQNQQQN